MRELAQPPHVLVLDVPPVLAQMAGDAVGAAEVRFDRRPDGVRLVRLARLPDSRHMVHIDAEFDHRSCSSFSTVRVCSVWPPRRCAISSRSKRLASSRVSARA